LRLVLCLRGDSRASLLPLLAGFEEEFADSAPSLALGEIEKGTMLESAPATAIGFAAGHVLSDIRGSHKVWRNLDLP